MKSVLYACIAALIVFVAGCSKIREFKAQFINRADHEIAARVDGSELGRVPPGGALTFRFDARVLEHSGYYGGPYEAEVTFSAYDIVTGKSTRGFRRRIHQDRTETVEVNPRDFQ